MPWPWDDDEILDLEHRILRRLDHIRDNQEQYMATVQALTDLLTTTTADLQTLIAAGVGGIPETELDGVLAAVQQLDDAIKAAIPAAVEPQP